MGGQLELLDRRAALRLLQGIVIDQPRSASRHRDARGRSGRRIYDRPAVLEFAQVDVPRAALDTPEFVLGTAQVQIAAGRTPGAS